MKNSANKNKASLIILALAILLLPSLIQADTTTPTSTTPTYLGYVAGANEGDASDADKKAIIDVIVKNSDIHDALFETEFSLDDFLQLGKIDDPLGTKTISLNTQYFTFSLTGTSFDGNQPVTGSIEITNISGLTWTNPLFFTLKAGKGYTVYDSKILPFDIGKSFTFDWGTTQPYTNNTYIKPYTGKGLSHISFWSTTPVDPPTETNSTPEPSTFVLLGLGLIFCSNVGRKRIKK